MGKKPIASLNATKMRTQTSSINNIYFFKIDFKKLSRHYISQTTLDERKINMNNKIFMLIIFYFPFFRARLGNKRMIMQKKYLKLSSNDFILFSLCPHIEYTVEKSYQITKLLPHSQKKHNVDIFVSKNFQFVT